MRSRLAALLVLATLVIPVEGWSEEPAAPRDLVIRAPDSLPPLEGLIRQGLEHSARGNLAGAWQSWQRIRENYPEHPAAPTFEIYTLETRKSLDFQDSGYDEQLQARANEALALSESWLARVPDEAEAHFYAGQAKYELMILAGMAGRYYRAGTSGEEARKHLERAIELDPTLVDAKLPLGSYYYYAAIATRFIRWFSWLWFVPTGERDLGVAYVEEVAREGDLLRTEAAVQLARIHLYLDDRPELAAPILERLHREYPENSHFAFEVLELRLIQDDYTGVVEKALEIEASDGTQFGDDIRRTMAKIWRARAELLRGHADRASGILSEVDGKSETLTSWCTRWFLLTKGNLADVLGRRAEAVAYYERVIELKSRWNTSRSVELARQGLEVPFRAEAAEPDSVVGALRSIRP